MYVIRPCERGCGTASLVACKFEHQSVSSPQDSRQQVVPARDCRKWMSAVPFRVCDCVLFISCVYPVSKICVEVKSADFYQIANVSALRSRYRLNDPEFLDSPEDLARISGRTHLPSAVRYG